MKKKMEILTKDELKTLKGGRKVFKYDVDGDGKWDVKIIRRNNGTLKYVYR
jgi:hypothetical protein